MNENNLLGISLKDLPPVRGIGDISTSAPRGIVFHETGPRPIPSQVARVPANHFDVSLTLDHPSFDSSFKAKRLTLKDEAGEEFATVDLTDFEVNLKDGLDVVTDAFWSYMLARVKGLADADTVNRLQESVNESHRTAIDALAKLANERNEHKKTKQLLAKVLDELNTRYRKEEET